MAESEDGKMSAGNKENWKSKEVNERKWFKRSRIREVDFMRVEDTQHGQTLHPFELEVKEKIASQASPLDEMQCKEEKNEKSGNVRVMKWRISHLVKKASFTPGQEACYRLLYLEKLPAREAAERLSVSKARVCQLRKSILRKISQAYREQMKKRRLMDSGALQCKTRQQRLVCGLRYKLGLSSSEIALRIGRTKRAVDRMLERSQKIL